jgi:hypothetical protein
MTTSGVSVSTFAAHASSPTVRERRRRFACRLRSAEPYSPNFDDACQMVCETLAGEQMVSGALRAAKADVSEMHRLDGLRLAVELKPVNLAVGRAIWNRFGDIRTFAVNLHLKFPFAVVGGVLVVPTSEETASGRKSTRHLISRAVNRLVRAGGRRTEGDAPHLLEGIAVVVYDPQTGRLDSELPSKGTSLRWPEFVDALANAYNTRFGEGELAAPVESDTDTE